ncbi:hypothetical protein HPB48_024440 [Haemaphysalis longicornis]|uniref:Aquaporin n=1 Tax=Haemaphysalis longicornis TaxID=44386 RepID=A0A9J6H8P5_HAELO|nr:hypothetical protein HPB48_024440 [Haemaphysalis longicornis]
MWLPSCAVLLPTACLPRLPLVSVPGHQSSLGSNRPHEALGAWQAFGIEFVLSFLLASTVFATRDPHRNHLGGNAVLVGFAYLACTLAGLPATGASMNPARSLGPAFVMNKWIDHWVSRLIKFHRLSRFDHFALRSRFSS